MQAYNTQILTLPTPYPTSIGTITNASLQLTRPDGGVETVSATVSSDNSLNATYTPELGGLYRGLWLATLNNAAISISMRFFVVWTDVYDVIRQLLGNSKLTDNKIDKPFQDFVTMMQEYAPAIGAYWQFNQKYVDLKSGERKYYNEGFDQGASYIVAAEIRPFIGGKRPTGEISLFKKGTTTIQYAAGTAISDMTLEDQWRFKGMDILKANIPEIKRVAEYDRYGDEVMTRGPLTRGNPHKVLEHIRQTNEEIEGEWELLTGYNGFEL